MVSWVSGTIGVCAAGIILWLIRRDHLHARYGPWWVGVAAAFVVFGIYPQAFDRLAATIGVSYGPVLALTLAVTVLFLKSLMQDISRSRTDIKVDRLVQRMAILESELDKERGAKEAAEAKLLKVAAERGQQIKTGTKDA